MSADPYARVAFGAGALARLPEAVTGCGGRRAFVVTDPGLRAVGLVDRVSDVLSAGGIETDVWDRVAPNPSVGSLEPATAAARRFGDCVVVGLGGGSAIDAAKAIALLATPAGADGLPVVAVPTTAGTGAETNGFGVLEDPATRTKVYVGHASVRPRWSVLDPELTVGLPPAATAATGMDALVHGIESLASLGCTPASAVHATEAIRLVAGSLAAAVADGSDLDARTRMLMGSHLAGMALSLSGLGLVHGIGHAVTAHTGAVHGLALSAVVDEVMTRSLDACGPAYEQVADSLGVAGGAGAAVPAVQELAERVGVRRQLRELGVEKHMLASVAAGALADVVSRNHPRPFSPDEVTEIVAERW